MQTATVNDSSLGKDEPTLFGHPVGLFVLFFAEMWERFSYYGMRSLLFFYMTKGFLQYKDSNAYTVYGAYTALVYMTPFFGGLAADRIIGARRAVILGGIAMAAGHLLMMREDRFSFFFALALIILGNGFFKPNVSTMVGMLYPKTSGKKDSAFTIFYMGINLGAAISPLLCGYIGETYGWHWGFGLATIGMLAGLAIFIMPNVVTQALIASAALATAVSLAYFHSDNFALTLVNYFIAISLLVAAVIACVGLSRGGLPAYIGQPPVSAKSGMSQFAVYGGAILSIPIFAVFVSGFSLLRTDGSAVQLISEGTIKSIKDGGTAGKIFGVLLEEISKPAGLALTLIGTLAFAYLLLETFRQSRIWRDRMLVALTLIFFQFLFFAFFEQAGSSLNAFTDRNVDRVSEAKVVTADMVGTTIKIQPTQEQIGYSNGADIFTMTTLSTLRADAQKANGDPDFEIDWEVSEDDIGMGIATRNSELPASIFQSVNAIFILIFGLVFSSLWAWLRVRNIDPNAGIKFGFGLMQLGLGFVALWVGAVYATERGMIALPWLILAYLLHTTGELCLSPVGLSQMTKLSPRHLVSTVMGSWFLATAFSQYLASMISQFTESVEGGETGSVPVPSETLGAFVSVYYTIGIVSIVAGAICLALSPLLKIGMHENETDPSDEKA